ncbi:prealbumin-like fold domain-containing protein [Nonomuraea soli]|uniref:SpaA-like prealbumin fold domain-containing protein n=1 Tax=Nonomuraea soli TaxID=1032476 RepID=A0A7W0CTA7_9ACTN|nr:hypothetical protein [Nonomuraea soli]MBA2896959.1 hypothetical protein [Nonomuraea soli]
MRPSRWIAIFTACALSIAGHVPLADAALGGLTDFEIDGNMSVDGSRPGAGVDWDNAATAVKGSTRNDSETCTGKDDDTLGDSSLNDLDVLRPVVSQGDNVPGKTDLCNAYAAWEAVQVGDELHYILYSAWRRNPGEPGQVSFYIPIVPASATSNADVRLIRFDYESNTGATTAYVRSYTGSGWNQVPQTAGFQAAVSSPSPASFGEFALDLTEAGIITEETPCQRFAASYAFTQTGNSDSAKLKDYVGFRPSMVINTCSMVRVTKQTSPESPDPAAAFDVTLAESSGAASYSATLTVPGSPSTTFNEVLAAPDYTLTESGPPAPWSLRSIVCQAYTLTSTTPATITLVSDGVPTGDKLPVVPPAYAPGSQPSATCTITNRAPSLTLIKEVDSTARPNPPATPDMWLLNASGPQNVQVKGSKDGVTTVVRPGTYTLSEQQDPANPPPVSYLDGTTWDCGSGPTTTVVITATSSTVCRIVNTASPAELTLVKVVDSTGDPSTPPAASDFELTATFQSGEASDPGVMDGGGAVSGTTGTPAVTDRKVKRGVYGLAETTVPGYRATWRCVDGNGTVLSTAPQVSIPTVDEGDRANTLRTIDVTCTVTNTFTQAKIEISGPAVNAVGEPHDFVVTVTQVGAGGTEEPVVGIVPDLAIVPQGDLDDYTVDNGCLAGTDANGQCTVTVTATEAGVIVIEGRGLPDPFNVTFTPPTTSQKRFRAYRVDGEASGVNLAGQDHTFTLSGIQFAATDAGGNPSGQGPLQAGSVIRFTWDGPGEATGTGVTSLGGQAYQCVVDDTGTCQATVTSAVADEGTLTVTGISVFLDRGEGVTTESRIEYGQPALVGSAPVLTKTWVSFDVSVDRPNAVNLIRREHTFTFTVTQKVGSAAAQPVRGGTLTYDWVPTSDDLTIDPAGSCSLGSAGTCDVVVRSSTLGTGRITVTGLRDVPVSDGVTLSVATTDAWASSSLTVPPSPPTKTWVGFTVALLPQSANNLVGERHVITVRVTGFGGPAGPAPGPAPVSGARVEARVVSGSATFDEAASTCSTGTSELGDCTLVYVRQSPGKLTIELERLHDLRIAGTNFGTVPIFDPDHPDGAPGMVFDLEPADVQAAKTWWDVRVRLSPDAVNDVGDPHVFTATVERTADGSTWEPVPDDATLTSTWEPSPAGSSSVVSDTCASPGTRDGVCRITVTSAVASTGVLTVTGVTLYVDRDGNGVIGDDVNGDGTITSDEYGDELAEVSDLAPVSATKRWQPGGEPTPTPTPKPTPPAPRPQPPVVIVPAADDEVLLPYTGMPSWPAWLGAFLVLLGGLAVRLSRPRRR